MIRRLAAAIRRLTRRQPTPPSEPHSPWPCDVDCEWCDNCDCGTAPTVLERPNGSEPTTFDRIVLGPDDGAAPATVPLPTVRDEDQHDAAPAALRRSSPIGGAL